MMNQQRTNALGSTQFRNSPNIMDGIGQPVGGSAGVSINSPPLPPRRPMSSYQTYNPFGSYMGGYGYGSGWNNMGMNRYGSMGPYPGYSLYGQNQWSGPSGDVENRFVQYAEESTRPAFQSIETMVHTFSSVTMMLESTFFAMTSSFRAILGVAENVGKLRLMLRQLLNNFALIRFLKWLYWKIKYTLGLRNQDTNSEILWRETISEIMNGHSEQPGTSSWPIFLFLSILFATPYIIHKLVHNSKNMSIDVKNPKEWLESGEAVYTATALYSFKPASSEELPLKIGQKVWLAPQTLQPKNLPGWSRATDSINVGLIPSNYVTIVGQLKKKSEFIQSQTTNSHQPSTLNEDLECQNVDDLNKINNDSFNKSKMKETSEMKNENN
ncbi:PREDICTED: peroxisomal membrane protein PEX13 [Ceratosolen solmsi marchali]|uniref:Peroxisomal membrane protein PEX13 n=1 Tax=Ceratosolen solmsi marchali TaxID=326594 RepID=A0AAJ6YKK6_9HYME|nr:PREDICTED: peroxisomal membrane protein PEX13 [Ceratosolen solmsi marchali]